MTSSSPPDLDDLLRRALIALEPYRDEVVIIGGIAKKWYRHLPGFDEIGLAPLDTNDVDVAMPEPLQIQGGMTLDRRFQDAGLARHESQTYRGQRAPCRYYLATAPDPARTRDPYVECLVPELGRERETPGHPQNDQLAATPVRFLDLLMATAIAVDHPIHGSVRVPHPLAFAIVKTRMRRTRHRGPVQRHHVGLFRGKQARDQADLYYVLMCLRSQWGAWAPLWMTWQARSPTWKSWMRDAERFWAEAYATPASQASQEVMAIYPAVPADVVARTMAAFR